jgi:hypothetical protein
VQALLPLGRTSPARLCSCHSCRPDCVRPVRRARSRGSSRTEAQRRGRLDPRIPRGLRRSRAAFAVSAADRSRRSLPLTALVGWFAPRGLDGTVCGVRCTTVGRSGRSGRRTGPVATRCKHRDCGPNYGVTTCAAAAALRCRRRGRRGGRSQGLIEAPNRGDCTCGPITTHYSRGHGVCCDPVAVHVDPPRSESCPSTTQRRCQHEQRPSEQPGGLLACPAGVACGRHWQWALALRRPHCNFKLKRRATKLSNLSRPLPLAVALRS